MVGAILDKTQRMITNYVNPSIVSSFIKTSNVESDEDFAKHCGEFYKTAGYFLELIAAT